MNIWRWLQRNVKPEGGDSLMRTTCMLFFNYLYATFNHRKRCALFVLYTSDSVELNDRVYNHI